VIFEKKKFDCSLTPLLERQVKHKGRVQDQRLFVMRVFFVIVIEEGGGGVSVHSDTAVTTAYYRYINRVGWCVNQRELVLKQSSHCKYSTSPNTDAHSLFHTRCFVFAKVKPTLMTTPTAITKQQSQKQVKLTECKEVPPFLSILPHSVG
jgi:hypothetical protein